MNLRKEGHNLERISIRERRNIFAIARVCDLFESELYGTF